MNSSGKEPISVSRPMAPQASEHRRLALRLAGLVLAGMLVPGLSGCATNTAADSSSPGSKTTISGYVNTSGVKRF